MSQRSGVRLPVNVAKALRTAAWFASLVPASPITQIRVFFTVPGSGGVVNRWSASPPASVLFAVPML